MELSYTVAWKRNRIDIISCDVIACTLQYMKNLTKRMGSVRLRNALIFQFIP